MEHLLQITPTDIAQGRPKDPEHCPIAISATRAFTEFYPFTDQPVRVDHTALYWIDPVQHEEVVLALPAEAREFVKLFDDGEAVKPFAFPVNTMSCGFCGSHMHYTDECTF